MNYQNSKQYIGIPVRPLRLRTKTPMADNTNPHYFISANYEEICNLIVIISAEHFEVPINLIMGKNRAKAPVALARQVAVYLAHTSLSISYRDAAQFFHRDRTTIAHACRVIEDLRDRADFDKKLHHVERLVLEAASFIKKQRKSLCVPNAITNETVGA